MINRVKVFHITDFLFYAYAGIHQMRVFDYQKVCSAFKVQSFKQIFEIIFHRWVVSGAQT